MVSQFLVKVTKRGFFLFLCCVMFPIAAPANEVTQEDFIKWWSQFRSSSAVPQDLKLMEDYFISSPLINRCSKLWLYLNKLHIQQIAEHGYQNFRQTVACYYFTWVVEGHHTYSKNLWLGDLSVLKTIPPEELSKKHLLFTEELSKQYNATTALFYHYLLAQGSSPYLNVLDEPFYGNPPSIRIQGKSVSQDILNSLLEYLSITKHCDISNLSTVLELGAGSGRTASCFLKLMPNIKYIIVDIPPALFLSQTYLSEVFSKRKIFRFRPFENFEDVRDEMALADIIFLTPDQMLKLPDQSVDLFLAIDCLHEMKKDEVKSYFNEADRLASLFYFKCWNETVVPFDQISYTRNDYPVPSSWREIFKSDCFVPSAFFHALYAIR